MNDLARKILPKERNQLKQYCQYILNTGESVGPTQFDEDHEPIGPTLRAALLMHGLMTATFGDIYKLTEKGKALAND